mmetsp:Transcript_27804/g.84883  ORF Transcript_27804/g.84883 Transcript_27804/m.84883 type:complete len:200 (+) Transcript_27804:53-652(+)
MRKLLVLVPSPSCVFPPAFACASGCAFCACSMHALVLAFGSRLGAPSGKVSFPPTQCSMTDPPSPRLPSRRPVSGTILPSAALVLCAICGSIPCRISFAPSERAPFGTASPSTRFKRSTKGNSGGSNVTEFLPSAARPSISVGSRSCAPACPLTPLACSTRSATRSTATTRARRKNRASRAARSPPRKKRMKSVARTGP